MFKNSEPPISLFSFQDIITSLTGIMLFFVLILCLELLRATPGEAQDAPEATPEDKAAQALLLKHKTAAEQLRTVQAAYNHALYGRTAATPTADDEKMAQEMEASRQEMARLDEMERVLSADIRTAQTILESVKKEKAAAEAEEKRRVSAAEQRIRELRAHVAVLEAQKARVKAAANVRQDHAIISVPGDSGKTPLMLEFSATRVRIKEYGGATVQTVAWPNGDAVKHTRQFLAVLSSYPSSSYYLVFFVKPSAAPYFREFQNKIRYELSKYDQGREPVKEEEDFL